MSSMVSIEANATSMLNGTTSLVPTSQHYYERSNFSETIFYSEHIPAVIEASKYLPPIWWVIGILGNIVALIVWLQPKMRHSSGFYLAALAITDLIFLPLNAVIEINMTHNRPILNKPVLCEWFAISYMTVQHLSPVFVLAFTVERYLSVCHPFRMVNINQNNSKNTLLVITGLTVGLLALNSVQGYFWTTDHGDGNVICGLRASVAAPGGIWTYWTWTTEMLIFAAVPLTVLVLNILVIIEVRNISRLERRNMRTNSIDRRSTTLMLLGVSFYQIFTVLPVTVVYSLYTHYQTGDPYMPDHLIKLDPTWQSHMKYWATRSIIQNVGLSHYAINFFIYVLTGKIFRKQLYEMVVIACCKEKLKYLTMRTIHTRTTRMSLTSHRGSIGKGRLSSILGGGGGRPQDVCNNDTEAVNKNSMYSMAELETQEHSSTQQGHPGRALPPRLLSCVEESDAETDPLRGAEQSVLM